MNKWRKYILIGIVTVMVGFLIVSPLFQREETNGYQSIDFVVTEQYIEKTYIYVDIKGAVKNPGVYKLEKDSRLFQVIELAGGLLEEADQNALNFSIILADQNAIYIPTVEEQYPNITIIQDETIGGVININTASKEALESLPGIGPATAQSIIDYRDQIGLFTTIEDVMNVSGIGEATFDEIKDLITT